MTSTTVTAGAPGPAGPAGPSGATSGVQGPAARPHGHVTRARVVHSEWIKLRSLRSASLTLLAATVALIGLGALFSGFTANHWTSMSAHERAAFDPALTSLRGFFLAQLAVGVLGVLMISGEYATGMIRSSLAAVPRRLPVLWAKAAVFAGVVWVLMTVSSLVAFLVGQALMTSQHIGVALADPGVPRAVFGVPLYLTVVGLLGVGIGALIRNSAGGIAAVFGLLLVVPAPAEALPASWGNRVVGQPRRQVAAEQRGPGAAVRPPRGAYAAPVDGLRGVLPLRPGRAGRRGLPAQAPRRVRVRQYAARLRRAAGGLPAAAVAPAAVARGTAAPAGAVPGTAAPAAGGTGAGAGGAVRAGAPPAPGPVARAEAVGTAGVVGAVAEAAARVVRAYGRARLRVRRLMSPLLVDTCLAAALFTVMCVVLRGPLAQPPVVMLLIHAGLSWPLAFRRRAPLIAFGCMAAAALAQWAADIRTPADVTLLLALYAVAAAHDRARTLAAFGMLEVGIVLALLRWPQGRDGTGTFVSLSAMAIAATVIGSNVRGRHERMAVLEDRAIRLERERDQRAQLAVAGERARIAREMHDIVTHNLSVMVALADGALFAQEAAPDRAAAAMRQVGATGRQAITDMRRFLGVLRADEPDALRHPMPGVGRLGSLAEQVRATGLPTRLAVAGDPALVPAAAQLTVYRLVQEALTNTMKHAPAGTRAEVDVRCSAEAVAVTVTDDGAGAVPREPAPASGHGLSGMRERAAAFGGRLSAGPLPGGGWQVAAELVLTPTEDL